MSQGMASKRFLRKIGIELSAIENAAWTRRHAAAHGGKMADESIIDTIRETKLLKLIIHRIVLKITEASESYYDYYTFDFPIRKVPAPVPSSGLPSFSYRTEHLDENRLCYEHFSEPFDQGL